MKDSHDSLVDLHNDNEIRRMLYRSFVRLHFGPLRQGERKVVPDCVKSFIRELSPSPDGMYMGHRHNYNGSEDRNESGP